jgi:hypothetical protein
MQKEFGWGTNPYYYLAGKYSIHPTYIQEMLGDTRFSEEDIIAAINHLKIEDGPGRPLGRSFRVKLWPTLILLENGQELGRVVRPQQAQAIDQALGETGKN